MKQKTVRESTGWSVTILCAWLANTNLNILQNGRIVTSWANMVVLLDGDKGLILKEDTLPMGPTPTAECTSRRARGSLCCR